LGQSDLPKFQELLLARPVDIRYVGVPVILEPDPDQGDHQSVWLRARGRMPAEQLTHTVLLTFASDYNLLESVIRRHGLSHANSAARVASLDHAMWFHRPVRMDEWLLYTQESPSASGARGLGLGRIFTSEGILVASIAQEGMLRLPHFR
jgi:acyl-CoA thioesterase-2